MYRKTISFTLMAMLLSTGGLSFADTHNHSGHEKAVQHADEHAQHAGGIYPLSVDPLGDPLVDVDKPVSLDHKGRNLHFANEANAEAFNAEPDKYLAAIDQMIIEQQKLTYPLTTCVVSGEEFGGDMGEPIDYVYGNRLIRFCCMMCKADFNKDPDAYLAEIDATVIEAQKTDYPAAKCVVSGDELGGDMGEPVDYVLGSRLIRLCCKMCIKDFEANPAAYLVKPDSISEQGNDNHGDKPHQDRGSHGHENHH